MLQHAARRHAYSSFPSSEGGALPGEAGAQWREVVENSPDGILLTRLDGAVLGANPAACALLARTEEETCLAGRAGIVVLDDAARRFVEERLREGHARGVLTLCRKDGSTFLADVASTVFEGPNGESMTSLTFRDVTAVERAGRALKILADAGVLSSSLDLRTTLKNLTDLVVPKLADVCTVDLVEPDGIMRAAVAHRDPARVGAFEQVRRRTMREDASGGVDYVLRTGKPSFIFELTDERLQDITLDRPHFDAARALGVRSFVTVPLIARTVTIGALTLMSDGGVPSFGAADLELVQALGERAAMAIDNAHQHAEMVEARRLRDEVLAVVAHDLRAPLNTIQIVAGLQSRQSPSRETETIKRAVRRADELIHDLLLATKTESGTLPIDRRPQSVASILDEVRELHLPLAEAKSVRFVVAIDGELPRAALDRHRTVQMLSNLVANGIKFTPAGGLVELRSRTEPENILLTVSDTGAGIEASDLPFIFDRYWQGAHSRHLGAGLGLSISKGIARAHGGDIAVESVVGEGTTFTIVLPRVAKSPPDVC